MQTNKLGCNGEALAGFLLVAIEIVKHKLAACRIILDHSDTDITHDDLLVLRRCRSFSRLGMVNRENWCSIAENATRQALRVDESILMCMMEHGSAERFFAKPKNKNALCCGFVEVVSRRA